MPFFEVARRFNSSISCVAAVLAVSQAHGAFRSPQDFLRKGVPYYKDKKVFSGTMRSLRIPNGLEP